MLFLFPLRPQKVIVIASSLASSFPLPYTPPYLRVLAWGGRWREGLPEAKREMGEIFFPHISGPARIPTMYIRATFPRRKLKLVIIFHCGKIPEKVSPPPPLRKGASQPAEAIINRRLRRKTKEGSNSRPSPLFHSLPTRKGGAGEATMPVTVTEGKRGRRRKKKKEREKANICREQTPLYQPKRGGRREPCPLSLLLPFS